MNARTMSTYVRTISAILPSPVVTGGHAVNGLPQAAGATVNCRRSAAGPLRHCGGRHEGRVRSNQLDSGYCNDRCRRLQELGA